MIDHSGQMTKEMLITRFNSTPQNHSMTSVVPRDKFDRVMHHAAFHIDIETSIRPFSKILPANFLPDFSQRNVNDSSSPVLKFLINNDLLTILKRTSVLTCDGSVGLNKYITSPLRDDSVYQSTRITNGLALIAMKHDPIKRLISNLLMDSDLVSNSKRHETMNHLVSDVFHESFKGRIEGSEISPSSLLSDKGLLYPHLVIPCFTSMFDRPSQYRGDGIRTINSSAFDILLNHKDYRGGSNPSMTRPDSLFFSSYLNLFRLTPDMQIDVPSIDHPNSADPEFVANMAHVTRYQQDIISIVDKLALYFIKATELTSNYGYSAILQYNNSADAYDPYCFVNYSYFDPKSILTPNETAILVSFILGSAFANNGVHIVTDAIDLDPTIMNKAIFDLFECDKSFSTILRILLFPSILMYTLNTDRKSKLCVLAHDCFPVTDEHMTASFLNSKCVSLTKFKASLRLVHSMAISSNYYNTYDSNLPSATILL